MIYSLFTKKLANSWGHWVETVHRRRIWCVGESWGERVGYWAGDGALTAGANEVTSDNSGSLSSSSRASTGPVSFTPWTALRMITAFLATKDNNNKALQKPNVASILGFTNCSSNVIVLNMISKTAEVRLITQRITRLAIFPKSHKGTLRRAARLKDVDIVTTLVVKLGLDYWAE